MNADAFNREVIAFARTVRDEITELQKTVALEGLKRLVKRTPVDTGRARGGWQVEITPRPLGKVTATQSVAGSMGAFYDTAFCDKSGRKTIMRGSYKLAGLPPFHNVVIENSVEYILELEDGHSGQAPNGMLSLTLNDLAQMFT